MKIQMANQDAAQKLAKASYGLLQANADVVISSARHDHTSGWNKTEVGEHGALHIRVASPGTDGSGIAPDLIIAPGQWVFVDPHYRPTAEECLPQSAFTQM